MADLPVRRFAVTDGLFGVTWVLFAMAVAVTPQAQLQQILAAGLFGIVSFCVGAGIGALGDAVERRVSGRLGTTRQLIGTSIAGSFAGLSLIALLGWAGIGTTMPPLLIVLLPALLSPAIELALHRIRTVRAGVLQAREELVREAAATLRAHEEAQGLISAMRAAITSAVELELVPGREVVERKLAQLGDGEPAAIDPAGTLTTLVHNAVRPVTQILAASKPAAPERLGVWGSIRAIITTQPFHPTPIAAVYVLVSLTGNLQTLGVPFGLFSTVTGIGLIYAILGSGNAIMRRGRFPRGRVYVLTFIVLEIPQIVLTIARSSGSLGKLLVELTVNVTISAILVLLSSSLGSWRQRNERAQDAFRTLLDEEHIAALSRARVAADVARDVAQRLHGPVQARLAACAVALQDAARAGDMDAYTAALLEAHATLQAPLNSRATPVLTISQAVDQVAEPWGGIVDIHAEIDAGIAHVVDPTGAVEAIVEEAITNAVRHGQARIVTVRISPGAAGAVDITVTDDGLGPRQGGPGLGSALLDRLTGHRWELADRLGQRGSVLTATVQ